MQGCETLSLLPNLLGLRPRLNVALRVRLHAQLRLVTAHHLRLQR